MSRSCSSLAGIGGKGSGRGSVPPKQSQPSSSQPPIPVTQREEEKTKWFIQKRVVHPTSAPGNFTFLQEIPSIEVLRSFLDLNGVDKDDALATWLSFRFCRDPKNVEWFDGVCLDLTLDASTTPLQMQKVWEGMVKKVLARDDDLALWIECIKELSVWKHNPVYVVSEDNQPTEGFLIYFKTSLTESEYGFLAEDVKDFLRRSFEEHGVAFPENGFDHKFMREITI